MFRLIKNIKKAIYFLLIISFNLLFIINTKSQIINGKETTKTKKNFKSGADWSYILTAANNGDFHSRFGLTFNFNNRHIILIGPDFDIDFDLRFEYINEPYLRIGYQYLLIKPENNLKFYLIYESRSNWGKNQVYTKFYLDNNLELIPTQVNGINIDLYAGIGLRWYFFKNVYLNFSSGFGANISTAFYDYEGPTLKDTRYTRVQKDLFSCAGLGYEFEFRKKKN